jgi:hypothetical protein
MAYSGPVTPTFDHGDLWFIVFAAHFWTQTSYETLVNHELAPARNTGWNRNECSRFVATTITQKVKWKIVILATISSPTASSQIVDRLTACSSRRSTGEQRYYSRCGM